LALVGRLEPFVQFQVKYLESEPLGFRDLLGRGGDFDLKVCH